MVRNGYNLTGVEDNDWVSCGASVFTVWAVFAVLYLCLVVAIGLGGTVAAATAAATSIWQFTRQPRQTLNLSDEYVAEVSLNNLAELLVFVKGVNS